MNWNAIFQENFDSDVFNDFERNMDSAMQWISIPPVFENHKQISSAPHSKYLSVVF